MLKGLIIVLSYDILIVNSYNYYVIINNLDLRLIDWYNIQKNVINDEEGVFL